MRALASQTQTLNTSSDPAGAAKLSWVFVLVKTTAAVLRAKEKDEIAGLLCWLNNGRAQRAIRITGGNGLLGFAPAELTEEIAAKIEAAGPGRLEGEIIDAEGEQLIVRLRYLCRAQGACPNA